MPDCACDKNGKDPDCYSKAKRDERDASSSTTTIVVNREELAIVRGIFKSLVLCLRGTKYEEPQDSIALAILDAMLLATPGDEL